MNAGVASGLEPALTHALADELMEVTNLLSDLAADLIGDPETLRRHMHSLQAVDRITQTQHAIADLLRAGADTDHALAAVTLDDVARRVKARLAHHRARVADQ